MAKATFARAVAPGAARGAAISGATAPGAAIIDDDLRRDIAELLLSGTAPERVVQLVVARGIVGSIAEAEVARAVQSPYLRAAGRLQARLQKRDWLLANTARLERLRREGDSVARRHQIGADEFFEDFYCNNRPVVVTGLADHWPAMTEWTFAALAAAHGDAEIDVQWQRNSNAAYEMQVDRHTARQNFGAVVRRIVDGGPSNDFYVTAANSAFNKQVLGPLWGDIGDIPGILQPQERHDGFFWMGPQGTITPFHHDLTNNLMVQIVGCKRIKLVAASETPRMRNLRHCFSAWRGNDLPTGAGNGERPPVIETILEPGEALFLPIGWWHHVEGLTPTIGMSFTNFARDNDFYSHYASYGFV